MEWRQPSPAVIAILLRATGLGNIVSYLVCSKLAERDSSAGHGAAANQKGNAAMRSFVRPGMAAGTLIAGLLLIGALSTGRAQDAQSTAATLAWNLPTNEDIRKLLAERMRHNGVGAVIGVIEPSGERIVVWGRSGAADGRALD